MTAFTHRVDIFASPTVLTFSRAVARQRLLGVWCDSCSSTAAIFFFLWLADMGLHVSAHKPEPPRASISISQHCAHTIGTRATKGLHLSAFQLGRCHVSPLASTTWTRLVGHVHAFFSCSFFFDFCGRSPTGRSFSCSFFFNFCGRSPTGRSHLGDFNWVSTPRVSPQGVSYMYMFRRPFVSRWGLSFRGGVQK